MMIWGVVAIVCSAMLFGFILKITKMGLTYSENIERIRHGYPTLDGKGDEKTADAESGLGEGVFSKLQ